jgi:hypothetical protein
VSLRYPVPASELINYTDDNGLSCWIEPDPWPAILHERIEAAKKRITPEMVAECKAEIERAKERREIK